MNIAFIIPFTVFGTIFGFIAMVIIVGATDTKTKVWGVIISISLTLIISTLLCVNVTNAVDNWNDGYCECGTHWELKGVAKSRNGITTKYYSCPNCYAEIEQ